MTQTELQKLKQEYAEGDMSDEEFERRLDEVDLDATPPTLMERLSPFIEMGKYIAIIAIFIAVFFITKGQIMVVLPSLAIIFGLLWLLWWVVKNDV